jgi:hypothetical protein
MEPQLLPHPASTQHTLSHSLTVHLELPGPQLDTKDLTDSLLAHQDTTPTPLQLLFLLLLIPFQFVSLKLPSVEMVSVLDLKLPFPHLPLVASIVVVSEELSLWLLDKRINWSTLQSQFGLIPSTLPLT